MGLRLTVGVQVITQGLPHSLPLHAPRPKPLGPKSTSAFPSSFQEQPDRGGRALGRHCIHRLRTRHRSVFHLCDHRPRRKTPGLFAPNFVDEETKLHKATRGDDGRWTALKPRRRVQGRPPAGRAPHLQHGTCGRVEACHPATARPHRRGGRQAACVAKSHTRGFYKLERERPITNPCGRLRVRWVTGLLPRSSSLTPKSPFPVGLCLQVKYLERAGGSGRRRGLSAPSPLHSPGWLP